MASEAVAVAAVIMVFSLAGLALTLLTYFLVQAMRMKAQKEYRNLAELAVRSHQEAAASAAQTNRLLGEIERLLREV